MRNRVGEVRESVERRCGVSEGEIGEVKRGSSGM